MGDKKIEISVKAIQKIMQFHHYEDMMILYIDILMQCRAIDADNVDTFDNEFVSRLNWSKERLTIAMSMLLTAEVIEKRETIKAKAARAYNLRIVGV